MNYVVCESADNPSLFVLQICKRKITKECCKNAYVHKPAHLLVRLIDRSLAIDLIASDYRLLLNIDVIHAINNIDVRKTIYMFSTNNIDGKHGRDRT